ncbi:MAG: glucose-6-phosphate isomerase [candidate division Zixibacteria bacterium]|nr:glucose-6-phosphate isomerase [candidate division Zixibacteria bacterium]
MNYQIKSFNFERYRSGIEETLKRMENDQTVTRIWSVDHTVWSNDPKEISNRLGWLKSPVEMKQHTSEIKNFAEEVRRDGYTNALLLGMGGSSLAPEVFRLIFGVGEGSLDLAILDSTDPDYVREMFNRSDPAKTLYIVSTKSGTTIETFSFFKYCYRRCVDILGESEAGRHFAAITDPGSSLEELAGKLSFRKTFLNDPDIGGRYSALSFFGLVPAALVGADIELLLNRAGEMGDLCREETGITGGANPGLRLGTLMGVCALNGTDKLTLAISPEIASMGSWLEQLIAESTGKEGMGIVPVDGEELIEPEYYANDRLFVHVKLHGDNTWDRHIKALIEKGFPAIELLLEDKYDLASQFFLWEMATAVSGEILKINPFDQPNVESAKTAAKKMMSAYSEKGELPQTEPALKEDGIEAYTEHNPDNLGDALESFFEDINPGGQTTHTGRSYAAIQAFIKPSVDTGNLLQKMRTAIQRKYKIATTAGYGPRFLHSTGQLHKGDSGNGLFIQFTSGPSKDIAIPDSPDSDDSSFTFGVLKIAQAMGDRQALLDNKRKIIRFHIGADIIAGLEKIVDLTG